jgi:hypothetical protein
LLDDSKYLAKILPKSAGAAAFFEPSLESQVTGISIKNTLRLRRAK